MEVNIAVLAHDAAAPRLRHSGINGKSCRLHGFAFTYLRGAGIALPDTGQEKTHTVGRIACNGSSPASNTP